MSNARGKKAHVQTTEILMTYTRTISSLQACWNGIRRQSRRQSLSSSYVDLLFCGQLVFHLIVSSQRNPPAPTRPKIVLAKMRPGQVISLECHAIKGIGQDHAKWSPVGMFRPSFQLLNVILRNILFGFCSATASYRLHPHITLLKQPAPHLARKFADCFSPGVIKVVNEGTRKPSPVWHSIFLTMSLHRKGENQDK